MKKYLLFIFLFLFYNIAFSQKISNIVEGSNYNLDCTNPCTTLHLSYPHTQYTTSYNVTSIPYHTVSISGSTVSFTNDDYFSNAIPIGFNFCFFGNMYSQVYVSDNGHLTFNSSFNGSPSSFATQSPLPNYVPNSYPDNAVFGPFMDCKLSLGGSVKYATVGTAPFRKFVVQYTNVPFFNNGCTSTTPSNFQIVLYETYNQVECNITNKEVCNSSTSNWLNYATLGIQSIAGANYYIVPGRNASIWTAYNESWLFDPAGGSDISNEWRDINTNTLLATNQDSIYTCGYTFPYKIYVKFVKVCPTTTEYDTITLHKISPNIDSITIAKPTCFASTNGCITIYASGANPPFTYAYNAMPYQNSNTICNLGTGMIAVHVKDANGCIKDTSFFITPQSKLMVVKDSVQKDSCPLNNGIIWAHADSGVAPYTYMWSNGDTTSTISNLVGGANYTVTVTDAVGCTKSTIIYVDRTGLPKVTVSTQKPKCGDSTGIIFLTAGGIANSPIFHYAWANGDTTSYSDSLHSAFYQVTVTNANGCSVVKNIYLPDTLNITTPIPTITHTKCGLNNGAVNTNPVGGFSPFTYTIGSIVYTAPPTGLAPGIYTVITMDSIHCKSSNVITINPSDTFKIKVVASNAHCDSINGVIQIVPLNGIYPFLYNWSTGSNATLINHLPVGIYWVTVTDSIGCIATDTVQLGNDGSPHLALVNYNPPSCYGDSSGTITLTGISGLSPYKYSIDGINFSAIANLNNISGGTYTIYIRDANSCIRDTIITFTQPDSLKILYSKIDTLVCYNDKVDSITIQASGGFSPYQYQLNNSGFSVNNIFKNLSIGIQTIQVTDSNNCIKTFYIEVPGPTSALTTLLTKTDVPCFHKNEGSINAVITGGWLPYTYSWSNGANSLQLDSLASGNYIISVTDNKGCSVQNSIDIEQKLCCLAVIPNAFSPNGDSHNDQLKVLGISDIDYAKLIIVNRFGKVVFQTKNINDSWDGKFAGKDCDMGTYFYYFEYKCPFISDKIILKGDVTLVR